MGLFDDLLDLAKTAGSLGITTQRETLVSTPKVNTLEELSKTIKTVDALITDQKTEGKKEGYSDAAAEYEGVYSDLKQRYDKLIADINLQSKELELNSQQGTTELYRLEQERDRLKNELNRRANDAAIKFNVSATSILSSLNSGSSSFFSSIFYYPDFRDRIIAKKMEERAQARKAGYLEAKSLYEEKIAQLKEHYRRTKAKADGKMRDYADHMGNLLKDIENIKFEIADLKLAMEF